MRFTRKIFLAFCLCFGLIEAAAQYRLDNWTVDDGLPQNSVNGIIQTRDGYLWLATLDGLARFDGVRSTVFNRGNSPGITNNRFTVLFEDANGDLWASTEESGIFRYHNGRFSHYGAGDNPSIVWAGRDADGNAVIALQNRQALRFTGRDFSAFDDMAASSLAPLAGRRQSVTPYCLFNKSKTSVACLADGQWTGFLPADGFADSKYVAAGLDADGVFWVINHRRELLRVENGRIARVYNQTDGLPEHPFIFVTGARLSLLSWDGKNSLLLTDLARMRTEPFLKVPSGLRPGESDLYPPYAETGLPVFKALYEDREGNIWISTMRTGLYRARRQTITTYSRAEGLTETNVYPIYEDTDGSLLVGTTSGLFRLANERFAPVKSAEKFYVQAIGRDPAGRVVVSDFGRLYALEENRFVPFPDDKFPVPTTVFALHTDRENRFWIGANDGLTVLDGDGAAKTFTAADGLAGNDVKVIINAKAGGVWIGTYGGLSLYKDGKFTSWTENDGLPSRTVRSLYEDADGALWIGSYDGGLARFQDGRFTSYNSRVGLPNDGAFQILEDERRNFWISSNHGIYRVKKDELNEFADGKRANVTSIAYGKSDGMLNAECNGGRSPAGVKTGDGRLWFPTQDGVAMIDPRNIKINLLPPPVVIETVKVDNVLSEPPASAGGSVAAENPPADASGSDLVINPDQSNFEINYTALSFINSENLRFKYRLEGLDDDWIDAGTRRLAYYSHVPPGSYTFRVIAANSDGVWNEQGAALKVVVLPAFYRTWWFILLSAALILLIVYAVYRRRVAQLERARRMQEEFSRRLISTNEAERRRIAGELHDSIGQSLAMIKNRAVLSAESVSDEAVRKQLDLITAQTTQTIGEVREISYALRPYLLDNLGLTKAVESLLDKIAETGGLKIQTKLDDVDGIFDGEAEMSIYRIIQESMSNVLKHADASEAQVFLQKSERNLTILVSDNGKGFDPNAVETKNGGEGGFGLLGIAERVKMLGGTQEIESETGGTTILIKIPVPNR